MKRLLIVIALTVALLGSFSLWLYTETRPPSNVASFQDFLIIRGSSAADIGDRLKKAGLIKSSLAFKLYVQVSGKQRRIQAGVYRLSPSFSLSRTVSELVKGPVEVWVTIPEGLRREEVADRFASAFNLKSADTFSQDFLTASKGKEGFLFPDTYLFPKTASASAVVAKMLSIFDKRVDSKMKDDISKSDYTLSQIVTVASIIERETKTDEERPVVSGILYKRLKIGMALQVDATLQYAMSNVKCQMLNVKCDWWEPLAKDDLEVKSPYNTYKYPGLPPTPIANPGLSSIKAAIYPADSPYLYYLHDKNGVIHYARDLEEHNQNITNYLGK